MLTTQGGRATRVRTLSPATEILAPAPVHAPAPANEAGRPAFQGDLTAKQAAFLAWQKPDSPCLVVDLDMVEMNYRALAESLAPARIHYAVKANPHEEILARLEGLGSNFDVASRGEIEQCLTAGIAPERLSFGNTIKKVSDIAFAYAKGVRLFAFDADEELEKLAEHAPGAQVYCRLLVDGEGAAWPLSRKFGCSGDMAHRLLRRAAELGLEPVGLSFHVGSQQRDLTRWDAALARAAAIFAQLDEVGIHLSLVNLGGGFPGFHEDRPEHLRDYGASVMAAVGRAFGDREIELIAEPGRAMVGNAGVIETEVVLVSRKSADDERRWVYLDVGMFGGLAETMGEAIVYQLRTDKDGGATGPVVLAGPTCDSADILYEKVAIHLPLDLKAGDKVRILGTGAYTTTYASVGFNGFKPLAGYCV